MYIFDIENKSLLKDVLIDNLKVLGVRCRPPKKIKENEKENVYSDHQIFQKPLHLLKKCITNRLDGSTLEVPEFIVDACNVIEKDIKTEGIFRRAGSTCKQRERKLEINQGKKVNCDFHVLDACSLVKLFFRELPQPIIPYIYHDIFLKCLLLSTYEKELDALMLALLLLPEENLATLAFFMEFLWKVSQHADKNKMNVKNLAIILSPTLMPVTKGGRASNNLEMAHHFKVVEMLIENAERIGKVPEQIVKKLMSFDKKQSKKKRRSTSITRMFTGLKKIVGRSSVVSEYDVSPDSTPDSLPSLGKRKCGDNSSKTNLVKKKRLSECSSIKIPTPQRCRMQGYASQEHSFPNPISPNVKRSCARSLPDGNHEVENNENRREGQSTRPSRLNLVRRCTTIKQKSQSKLAFATRTSGDLNVETEKIPLERKLSMIWGHRKSSSTISLHSVTSEDNRSKNNPENKSNLSDCEFITVPKSEYEEIKNRVSALEEDLEKLHVVHSIQTAYEKTLEEAEKLNDGSTDQLAKRLSRELKIRRSLDNQIIRSPSARKIGSIRRRSKELVQKNSDVKISLKRGRPNTLHSGLPSPRGRALSSENISSSPKKTPLVRSATFKEQRMEWKSGDVFFAREHLLQTLSPVPQGRPSIAEIRCQNAGMVLEKAKLFNSLNGLNESGVKVPRRQSVRLENSRRLNDTDRNLKKTLTRTRSLGSDKKTKTSPLLISVVEDEAKVNDDLKEVILSYSVSTPKPQRSHASKKETPMIKKSLVTRSPRHLGKTPMSQMKSSQRPRATPMKVLLDSGATPHIGLRRSPRILARTINTPQRHKD